MGIRAVVDGAVQARAERRRVDEAKVRLRVAELADKADEIGPAPAPGIGRCPTRWRGRQSRAEAARTGPPAPKLWEAVAGAWESLNEPIGTAYCTWRQAEALLAGRSGRTRATALVTDAWRTAVSLGAEPLRLDIEDLARRARIQLEMADETPSAAATARSDLGLTQREVKVLGQLAAGRSATRLSPRRCSSARRRPACTCRTFCASWGYSAASTPGRSDNRRASARPPPPRATGLDRPWAPNRGS